MKEAECGIQFRKLCSESAVCVSTGVAKARGEEHDGPLSSLSMQHAETPMSQGQIHLGAALFIAARHVWAAAQPSPHFSLPPYFGYSNTKAECIRYRNRLHIHGVSMAQTSAIPAAPGIHLSSGCQGQVVVTVWMGSNFYNVSGGKPLDQLWGLKKVKTGGKLVSNPRTRKLHDLPHSCVLL